ncbi:MAG: bifunctional nuclease family protein [Planctomycetota bacterium]
MPVPMELSRVLILDSSPEQFITLAEKDGPRSFAIKIGTAEAVAIDRRLRGEPPVRPQTHELVDSILRELGATVERIVIHRLDGGTYYASLYLRTADGVVEIDARPSDAIAVGVGHATPIEVAEEVLAESAEERPDVEPPIEAGGNDDDDDDE